MDHLLSKEYMSFSILLVMFLEHCTEHWKLYSRTNKKKINSNNFLELAVKKIG